MKTTKQTFRYPILFAVDKHGRATLVGPLASTWTSKRASEAAIDRAEDRLLLAHNAIEPSCRLDHRSSEIVSDVELPDYRRL